MNLLSDVGPGPYLRMHSTVYTLGIQRNKIGKPQTCNRVEIRVTGGWAEDKHTSEDEVEATTRLVQLMTDHALLLAAVSAGKAGLLPVLENSIELSVRTVTGEVRRYVTEKDLFDCPKLTDETRTALRSTLGLP